MKYRAFVAILNDYGFVEVRTRGSHHQFRGTVGGLLRLVTVDFDQLGKDISPKNLASMIRQSGLDKRLFR